MTVFSWELAEALALAHMKQLGFSDSKSTGNGADRGLDVASSKAAAQVKAWSKPVGAPELQKLKGAAHAYQHVLFYSLSGYTAQASEYAASVGISLFTFTSENAVEAVNEYAMSLERDHSLQPGYATVALKLKELEIQMRVVSDLGRVALEWVALSPLIHMVPQEYQNLRVGQLASHLAGPALLQLEAAAVAISQDPEKAMEVVESGNQMAEEFVVAIGENLDIDLSGLNLEEASKALQESLEGDTTRLRIGELRPGLVQEFGKDFESAWRFLLPVIRLGIRMQKFLKLANQKKNEIEAEQRIDLETHARTSEEWKRLRAAVANFQAWSDTTIESGHGNRIEGERLFLEVVQHYGGALSGFGIQGSEILAVTDAKPASWVNDEDDDEEC